MHVLVFLQKIFCDFVCTYSQALGLYLFAKTDRKSLVNSAISKHLLLLPFENDVTLENIRELLIYISTMNAKNKVAPNWNLHIRNSHVCDAGRHFRFLILLVHINLEQ